MERRQTGRAIATAHADVEIAVVVPGVLDHTFIGDSLEGRDSDHASRLGAGERPGKGLRAEGFGAEGLRAERATGEINRRECFRTEGLRAERFGTERLRAERFG